MERDLRWRSRLSSGYWTNSFSRRAQRTASLWHHPQREGVQEGCRRDSGSNNNAVASRSARRKFDSRFLIYHFHFCPLTPTKWSNPLSLSLSLFPAIINIIFTRAARCGTCAEHDRFPLPRHFSGFEVARSWTRVHALPLKRGDL